MGNKCSNDYIPREKFDNIASKKYKPNEIELLNDQLQKFERAKNLNIKFDNDTNIDINIKNNFAKKYGAYLDINRFAIPIIGAINSGKSTFLNNFLNLKNILQIGDQVTTRFISIIRHDKNAIVPEIYRVEIEKRNSGKGYNFKETGENILKQKENNIDNISKIIKELNHDIDVNNSQNSDKYLYDIEKYFLIIKTKIPIFEGEFEEYGDLIDFLDIPGLDEVRESADDIFNDFIPIIFYNILFPIFIFDLKNCYTDNSKNIMRKYLNLYTNEKRSIYEEKEEITYEKGIQNKEQTLKDFIDKNKTINLANGKSIIIPLEVNENFFGISSKNLNLEKADSFIEYQLEDIKNKAKKSKKNTFKAFIKDYLLTEFNIDLSKAKEVKENNTLRTKLDLMNNNLKSIKNLTNPKFDLKEFTFLSQFDDLSNIDNEEQKINNLMILKVQRKIKDELDTILEFDFQGLINSINSEEIKEKNFIKNNDIYTPEFIYKFNNKMNQLFPDKLSEKFKNIKDIKKSIYNFSSFYNNNMTRIIFIGLISSGKTSLLNSIIGRNYNILQTAVSECTRCIYRIKYSQEISFCESYINENENGNYFEDKNETRISDINQIKNRIKNLNKEGTFKFYSLYLPIEGLESIENKEQIELIDLPGITKNISELKIDLEKLFNMSDGFIFTFNSINIADENTHYILSQIINYIIKRRSNFNFENCLFNLNYIDQIDEDLLDEKVEEFKNMLIKTINRQIFTGNFEKKILMKKNILSSDNIKVSFISNLYYNQYQENTDKLLSLKFMTNNSLEDIYNDLIQDFDEDMVEKIMKEKDIDEKELKNNIELINQMASDKNDAYIFKIAKFILIFKQHKKELISSYGASKAEIFFQKFHSQIESSTKNNEIHFHLKIYNYFLNLLFKLYLYKELCSNEGNLDNYEKKIGIIKSTIEKEYTRIIKVIDKKFSNTINEMNKFQEEDPLCNLSKEKDLSAKQVMEKIQ